MFCTTCGVPVERNRRGELLHGDRMAHAHDHAATDTVWVAVIDWANSVTYSEGDEATVHATRADAVRFIKDLVARLGLAEQGLHFDPEGNNPDDNDSGCYLCDEGHLNFQFTETAIQSTQRERTP
jgi:hypothetical protein